MLMACGRGLVAVVLYVTLCSFRRVMHGVLVMAMRRMRVVSRSLMVAAVVMIRRVAMMLRSVLVVLGRLAMMGCRFLGHSSSRFVSGRKRCAGKLAGRCDGNVTTG